VIIFLAGAESSKYQEALLRGRAPSLQTFYAQRAIHEILNMKESMDSEERKPTCPTSNVNPS
jgi:hypothetical protein